MKVEVRNNNIDGALRILKKKMQSENVFNELRRKEFHESRGTRTVSYTHLTLPTNREV